MAQVQLTNLEKSFGETLVLRQLDLTVPTGCYLVLLGASGCGKTTTLKLIAGLDAPDRGQIRIGDREMSGVPPRERDVAMVFQGDSLYPHLTIEQSLRIGLQRDVSDAELRSRIEEATQLLGITELLSRRPFGLSGGESRRAAVAKAMIRRSSIRLLDEPLSALDANVRLGIGESLLQWHAIYPGTTIHVTHDGQEAMRLADQIAVMDHGRVLQCASPQEIYDKPVHRNVALAIGTPPVQFIPALANNGQLDFGCEQIRWHGESVLDPACGGAVSIGVRAQACHIRESDDAAPQRPGLLIGGTVIRSSMMNGQRLVRLRSGPVFIDVETRDCVPELGDALSVFVSDDELHVFDETGGVRLCN